MNEPIFSSLTGKGSYNVSGAGTSAANGVYSSYDTYGYDFDNNVTGQGVATRYKNENDYVIFAYIFNGQKYWQLSPISQAFPELYYSGTPSETPPLGQWLITDGASPAPTIS